MTDLSESKRIKLDDIETPPSAQHTNETITADWRGSILLHQSKLEEKRGDGAAFLAEMRLPPLPVEVSAAGVIASFKAFTDDKWSDNVVQAIRFYVACTAGSGACHAWLHARLNGLTFGDGGDCAWDATCTEDCVWLVLRYVAATPAMIEQGARIVRALETEAALVARASERQQRQRHQADRAIGYWYNMVRDLLATLDADPYWAAHPLDTQ